MQKTSFRNAPQKRNTFDLLFGKHTENVGLHLHVRAQIDSVSVSYDYCNTYYLNKLNRSFSR